MSDELKPCPFCGGKAELTYLDRQYRECFVKCLKCKVEQGHVYSSKKAAITAWNRRNNAPTVTLNMAQVLAYECGKDSVQVVLCKDCKHWHEDVGNFISSIPRGGCKLVSGITNGEFFCALGERRDT